MGLSSPAQGFTLLEVMVALAIVALGMMAVHAQLNRYAVGAEIIENKVLASWIASNRIAELSVAPQWPPLGVTSDEVDYARRVWIWRAQISETPVENLRRVDVSVALADRPEQTLHTVSGLLEPPAPPGIPPPHWLPGATGPDL
ncbi:MAG: type II secretion system minor pseudopilin GspI [Rhodospirillaceae bacterium]|nr:type II secretion system minor pseudopilin GspI [Rhodospirillaceae bacterium]